MSETRYRLRAIQFVSFVQSDWTIYEAFRKHKLFQGELRSSEVYLFVSLRGDQLLFVLGRHALSDGRTVLDTRKLRLPDGATWSVAMVQEYARAAGIKLEGFRTLSEHLAERHAERLRLAREHRAAAQAEPAE